MDADYALTSFVHDGAILTGSLYLRLSSVLRLPDNRGLEAGNTFMPFVVLYLVPLLAAVAAACIQAFFFGGRDWPLIKHLKVTIPLMLVTALIAWFLVARLSPNESRLVVAGTIVDQANNDPIGHAVVSLADGTSRELARELSEDNGNFKLDLTGRLKGPRVRIHVTKDGYAPADRTDEVPAEGLVIQLHHL